MANGHDICKLFEGADNEGEGVERKLAKEYAFEKFKNTILYGQLQEKGLVN